MRAEQHCQEEERRLRVEQKHQEEEMRLRAEQQLQEEQEREQEVAQHLAAVEMLVDFTEQIKEQETQTENPTMKEVSLQIDNSVAEMLKEENEGLRKQLQEEQFNVNIIHGNDQMTKFYTGLPT